MARLSLEEYDVNTHRESKCSICLNAYFPSQHLYHLKCNHYFHEQCLLQWFVVTSQCPVCRDEYF